MNQSIPDNELIEYYIDFMMRFNLQPIAGQFGRNIAPNNNMGGNNFGGNNFGGNNFGGNNFGGGGGQYNQPNQMLYQSPPMNQGPPMNQQPFPQQPMGQQNLPLAQPGYNV